ncbi:MAG: ATP-binding protein [Actinomycetota bacterium]
MRRAILTARFASAERKEAEEIRRESGFIAQAPHVIALLESFPVPAMILNSNRQIVAVNQRLTEWLGRPAEEVLGLRPGEAFNCVHSREEPGGCGTSVFCRMCGALKAILGSWSDRVPSMQECRLTCHAPHGWQALDLRVLAAPLWIGGRQFNVVSVMDITDEKRRMVLEQMFFHDVLNSATGIRGLLDLLPEPSGAEAERMIRLARELSTQLVEEIRTGQDLGAAERGELQTTFRLLPVGPFLDRICALYRHIPACSGKTLDYTCSPEPASIISDEPLLGRVLGNLIKNALEASSPGEAVTVRFDGAGGARFSVHNESVMADAVKLQVFQRSFSTRAAHGRGVGTYSVKMLVERYLQGEVAFRSEPGEGTTFTVKLPQVPAAQRAASA